MNDFTKEELIWLEEDLTYAIEQYQQQNICYAVREKIRNMITNYCDHEIGNYYVNHGDLMFNNRKCNKCGKII